MNIPSWEGYGEALHSLSGGMDGAAVIPAVNPLFQLSGDSVFLGGFHCHANQMRRVNCSVVHKGNDGALTSPAYLVLFCNPSYIGSSGAFHCYCVFRLQGKGGGSSACSAGFFLN